LNEYYGGGCFPGYFVRTTKEEKIKLKRKLKT
jgi:hypothetical protein